MLFSQFLVPLAFVYLAGSLFIKSLGVHIKSPTIIGLFVPKQGAAPKHATDVVKPGTSELLNNIFVL